MAKKSAKKASKKTAKKDVRKPRKGGKGRKFPKLPGGTVTLLTPKVDKPLHLVLLPR